MSEDESTNAILEALTAVFGPFIKEAAAGIVGLRRFTRIQNSYQHTDMIQPLLVAEMLAQSKGSKSRFWNKYVNTYYELAVSESGMGRKDSIKLAGLIKGVNATQESVDKKGNFIERNITKRDEEEKRKRDLEYEQ